MTKEKKWFASSKQGGGRCVLKGVPMTTLTKDTKLAKTRTNGISKRRIASFKRGGGRCAGRASDKNLPAHFPATPPGDQREGHRKDQSSFESKR